MRSLIIAVLLSCCAIALAAAAPAADAPKSLDARTAQARYDKAARDAELAYKNAMISACQTLISDLTAARDKVLKNGAAGLDEANRINASIEVAKADLRRLQGIAQTFTIRADQDWQSIGTLDRGTYRITAKGKWSHDPSVKPYGPEGTGIASRLRPNVGVLMARVGGKEITVGAQSILTISEATNVEFQIGDSRLDDGNYGSVVVSVVFENP